MAEEQEKGKSSKSDATEEAPKTKRKLPMKTLLVVAGVLTLEIGTVCVVMWLNDSPAVHASPPIVNADGSVTDSEDVESLIVDGKATNTKRGATFVYRYEIYAVIAKDDHEQIKIILDKRKATIEETVRRVIARLQPKELDEEPDLTTLKRLLGQEFEEIFGPGKVKRLVVANWSRFKADY